MLGETTRLHDADFGSALESVALTVRFVAPHCDGSRTKGCRPLICISGRVDPEDGVIRGANRLDTKDIGDVVLVLDREVAVAPYAHNRQRGSLILISRDTTDTAAPGLIAE